MTSPDGEFTYNSPPNWPAPPRGWTPAAGWLPNPAWPPAPDGWLFWVPTGSPPIERNLATANQGLDVYDDPDKRDLRPAVNPKVAMARARHNREVMARQKAREVEIPLSPASPPPAPSPAPAVRAPHEPPLTVSSQSLVLPAEPQPRADSRRKSFAEKRAERGVARDLKNSEKQAEKQAAAALHARQELLAQQASLQRHNREVIARPKAREVEIPPSPASSPPAPSPAPAVAPHEPPLTVSSQSLVLPAEPQPRADSRRKSFAEKRAERGVARDLKNSEKQAEKQAAAAIHARQELLAQQASLQEQFNFVAGWPENAPASNGLVLKKGEYMVGTVRSAGLVEIRRARGHVVGASSGVSVRVAKGVRLRAGAARGHYVPGDEQETQLDTGSATITSQRIVFSGSRQTREWKFEKLAGRQLTGNRKMSWLELPVSNRQKMSALSFPKEQADAVVSAIELALLFYQGDQGSLIDELRRQIIELADEIG